MNLKDTQLANIGTLVRGKLVFHVYLSRLVTFPPLIVYSQLASRRSQ